MGVFMAETSLEATEVGADTAERHAGTLAGFKVEVCLNVNGGPGDWRNSHWSRNRTVVFL
jgi:hypothetical protein